ncbi:TetR family transcriptional regulator [Trujillonella endophytica]|uniref:Transcriptional regulator, TetR family n=1 Tax=Trujillonella endophytica TaxID=673521 RepID=A0A1H8QQU4_9ACTN|nr:TetR family transcriptional regulator [Trujillella endophytica]SEO56223.1 transcriptional regulator, TetR family [Trujillella endophytica]
MSAPEPVVPVRERMRRETWLAIREAAYRLIAERGFDAVSVEDIAAAAGVSRATFFNYFASKLAVIQDPAPGDREAWSGLFDRPADEELWDSLVAILVDFAALSADQALKVRALYDRSPELHAHSAGHTHPFYVDLREFVGRRTAPGAERDAALLLNVALIVSDTAHVQWTPSPARPFAVELADTFDRLSVQLSPATG